MTAPVTNKVYTITDAADKDYYYADITLLDTSLASVNQQLDVYLTPIGTGEQITLVHGTDYDFTTLANNVTLLGTVATELAVGDILTIDRDTQSTSLYEQFTGLVNLRSQNIQNGMDQLLHLIQENTTTGANALLKNAAQTKWEGENLPSRNCAAAVDQDGWTTLSQVNSLISGAEIATTQDGYFELKTGDGGASFGLSSFPRTDIDANKIHVYIDGIHQLPTTDYTYALSGSTPTITFTPAPANGAKIAIRSLRGSVLASLDVGSVDGEAIIDGTLSVDAFDVSAGVDNRFLKFNTTGAASVETIQHTEISDFDAGVQTNRLDQMAAPTTAVDMNGEKLEDVATGTVSTDGVNLGQVQSLISAGTSVGGSNSFMRPTSGSNYNTGQYNDGVNAGFGLSGTVTGLAAGTYYLSLTARAASDSQTITANGVTRTIGNEVSGGSSTVALVTTVASDGILTVTSSSSDKVMHFAGFRLS